MAIELTVSEDVADNVVEQMDEKAQRMENVLQSFRSNELTDMASYENVLEEQQALVGEIEDLEEQIEEERPDGIEELFG